MMSIPHEASIAQSAMFFSCFALRLLYLLYIMSIHLMIIGIARICSMLQPGIVIQNVIKNFEITNILLEIP